MKVRIGTFNVENLFDRPTVMNYENNADGQPIIDDYHKLTLLLEKETYSPDDKKQIEAVMDKYKLMDRSVDHKELILREVRGKLWIQHQDGTKTWVAKGYEDFLGWVELVRESINDTAIKNTARVLAEVSADVQILIEVENRMVLQHFHDSYLVPELASLGKQPYKYLLSFQGNDEREINIALMSRLPVLYMKSNIDIMNNSNKCMFPRDCAQYILQLPNNKQLFIYANHFSSQGSDISGKRRKEQSATVLKLVNEGFKNTDSIAVMGDMNESYLTKSNLHALTNDPRLKDAMALDKYPDQATYPGTYTTATKSNKLDYILLSTALQSCVTAVNVERRGYFTKKWTPFNTVTSPRDQASDHHCVWVDLDL
jgi:endonuclease/exonuclease/phosphatase family metal-dependent hydrolase